MHKYLFSFILQAIILLIPAFLLIGIAWNLTLLYSGLFLYSFGKQVCIFFNAIFAVFVNILFYHFAAAAIVVPCLSAQVSGHGEFFSL